MQVLPILLVDDETSNGPFLTAALQPLGIPLESASSGAEALKRLEEGQFAVVLLGLHLSDMGGLEVLRRVRTRWPATPVIMIAAHGPC